MIAGIKKSEMCLGANLEHTHVFYIVDYCETKTKLICSDVL